jgi:hypothetical protein
MAAGNFIHTEGNKKYFTAEQVQEEKVVSIVLNELVPEVTQFCWNRGTTWIMVWSLEKAIKSLLPHAVSLPFFPCVIFLQEVHCPF